MADENLQLQDLEKKVTQFETNLVEMTKRAETAERELRVSKLSDVDKSAYAALSKADQEEYHACKEDKCREGVLAKGRDAIEKANAMPDHIQVRFSEIEKQLQDSESKRKAAEAAIAKAQDEVALSKFSKQAEGEFPNLPGTNEEKGAILKALNDKLTADEFGKVLTYLKAGSASHATLMQSVGKGTGEASSGNSAWDKIEAKAKEMVGKSSSLTQAQAIEKVLDTEPQLYTEYLKESGGRQ